VQEKRNQRLLLAVGPIDVTIAQLGRDALEKVFFGDIDTKGAKARDRLLAGGPRNLNADQRCDFARLLLSLDARRRATVSDLRVTGPRHIAESLGLEPDEVVYVCRGQFDIVGAKAAGLKVMWVNRAGEPLEDHGYTPDWEVKDFFEVAEVLKRERP
jgi:phosphoglycolate phosphatase-like HAD superfamily hydrolase